jgi:hypothetical protein
MPNAQGRAKLVQGNAIAQEFGFLKKPSNAMVATLNEKLKMKS